MKLLWLTDIHLNFLNPVQRIKYYKSLPDCDALMITGDIAESERVRNILLEMQSQQKKPIYFVLGNHDYYGSSVGNVETDMDTLCHNHHDLHWLPRGIILLTDDVVLVGQDTWADGRIGDFKNSDVIMNDWLHIADLRGGYYGSRDELLAAMQLLSDNAASNLRHDLKAAITHNAKHVMVLSHVPPFKEAALYKRHISDGKHLPFYTTKVVGDLLLEVAMANPDVKFSVFSGHTHSAAEYIPLPNLTVHVQEAEYNYPGYREVEI